jgi:hypothetical protein
MSTDPEFTNVADVMKIAESVNERCSFWQERQKSVLFYEYATH